METLFGRHGLAPPPSKDGAVVSIGVFDGVHLGHRAILAANLEEARAREAAATVVTFKRHPKKLLLGRAPKTLTSLEHRLELFRRAGIERALVLTFDEELRSLSAERFVREIAAEGLGARSFVLGFDSKFGRDREGTPERVRALGFEVRVVPEVVVGGRPVSSTAIREAVELGELDRAASMLGRPVSVLGRVVRGSRLGHEIGFPTANLDLHHELHPPPGVYACRARRLLPAGAEDLHPGVANIGYRPTVSDARPDEPVVEVHLFDFEGELYGERLELEFARRLRDEKRFANVAELKREIARDVVRAREVLADEEGRRPPR